MNRRSLLVLLLLASSAAAQTPIDPSVQIAAGNPSGDVSIDQAATVTLTVSNTSPGTGTPLDPAMQVSLSASGAPDGWVVAIEPSSFELTPGQTRTATMTVTVTAGAVQGDGDITVRALLRNGPPGQLSQSAEDSVDVTLRHDPSATRAALEALGVWFWAILAASFMLAGVAAYFGYDLFRQRIAMQASIQELRIAPGGKAVFPITIENLDSKARTVVFHIDGVDNGWAAHLPLPEVTLEPNEVTELNLLVAVPKTAKVGEKRTIAVRADVGSSRRPAAAAVQVRVDEA